MTQLPNDGTCDSRFSAVKAAFLEIVAEHENGGAALAVEVDGTMVVDIWAGFADAASTRPWEPDTIVNVYSATKGMAAVCAHRLVDQGLLELDAPVSVYWPEFAAAGKDGIPVRHLLSHQAGLPAIRKPMAMGSLYDWQAMTSALAEEEPWWEPGASHGYHALTFGFLVGEVVRRVAGVSLGNYFRKELAGPLGLDFHIGLESEQEAFAAEMIPAPLPAGGGESPLTRALRDPGSVTFKAFTNPPDGMIPGAVNTRAWRQAEVPAANGHGNARALARMYGGLANGGRVDSIEVLSRTAIDTAATEQCYGRDEVLFLVSKFGLGFRLESPERQITPTMTSFGHPGMGGSIAFADPKAGVGFAFTTSKMLLSENLIDPRWAPIVNAVYAAL